MRHSSPPLLLPLALLIALLPDPVTAQTSSPPPSATPASATPSPSPSPSPLESPPNTVPTAYPTAPPPPPLSISPEEAESRLNLLRKEAIELNEKLLQAEEELIGADPRLGELKRLMEEAGERRKVADENWYGVHERYTALYHQLRQKYDQELRQKIEALAKEFERKFEQEWSKHEAKRTEENRLMREASEKASAELELAARNYKAALEKTDFFSSPKLNAIRERMRQILRERTPLIMSLQPPARQAPPPPAATPATPSTTPSPTPKAAR